VRLGEEGVKILEVNTELRGGKLYATIRAVVDGVEEVCKIVFYRRPGRGRFFDLHVRGVEAKARAEKLRGANQRVAQNLARRPTAGLVSEAQAGT